MLLKLLMAMTFSTSAATCPSGKPATIAIQAPAPGGTPLAAALDDVKELLARGFSGVSVVESEKADVVLELGLEEAKGAAPRAFPTLEYPSHGYRWSSRCDADGLKLSLRSPSMNGLAFGLYGLLQEKLGYRFYHPREETIPSHEAWPLPEEWSWTARPRFDKKGFHLHTQHPTELAEQLHDPSDPDAIEELDEYFKWLQRNGQNAFSFYLLRDVDREAYPEFAKKILAAAKARGVVAGPNIGLATFQQRAFQAVQLLRPWERYRTQIERNLDWLLSAPWDFVAVDLMTGEWAPGLGALGKDLAERLFRGIRARGSEPILKTHVIRDDPDHPNSIENADDPVAKALEVAENRPAPPSDSVVDQAGIMVHSVMFYSTVEPKAPVYGNKNQRFMLEWAARERDRREVWYWPESAYWITFDINIPSLLLPYLSARLDDIEAMERLGVQNHLTFSSGWEWGYWLVDWSIARWSWDYGEEKRRPFSVLSDLVDESRGLGVWRELLAEQRKALKDDELSRLFSPLTIFEEFPRPLRLSFQPAPPFDFRSLWKGLDDEAVEKAERDWIGPLDSHGLKIAELVNRLPEPETAVERELARAMKVTGLRARHRASTLRYLIGERTGEGTPHLETARALRLEAAGLVREAERGYRYPAEELATERPSATAYQFGYLYTARDLLFWEREEEQARLKRFDWRYRNIWPIRKIMGVDLTLFFTPGLWSR